MNLVFLRYFLAVAEELNMTKAAGRIHLSQQALSLQIQNMERQLGVQLFLRSPALRLTYAGERLAATAHELLRTEERFMNELAQMKEGTAGRLVVGAAHGRAKILLPALLPQIKRIAPGLEIRFVELLNTARLEESLLQGELDCFFGITPISSPSISSLPLRREQLLFIIPKALGVSVEKESELPILLQHPILLPPSNNRVRQSVDRYFAQRGMSDPITHESPHSDTLFSLCLEGAGVNVLTDMVYAYYQANLAEALLSRLHVFPLPEGEETPSLVLARMQSHPPGKLDETFAQIVMSSLQEAV